MIVSYKMLGLSVKLKGKLRHMDFENKDFILVKTEIKHKF